MMVSGKELSDNEKAFIIENKDTMFPSQIAKELSERFPESSGGYRSPRVIRAFLRDEEDNQ